MIGVFTRRSNFHPPGPFETIEYSSLSFRRISMRTRRHFQPMLDSMPSRISPSAAGGLIAPVLLAPAATNLQTTGMVCVPQDTEMPESGEPTPIKPTPK
jgi:hypothetical protein